MARRPLSSALGLALAGAALVGSSPARAGDTASPALPPAQSPTPLLPPPPPAPIVKPSHVIWYGWEPLVGYAGVTSLVFALLRGQPLTSLTIGTLVSPLTTMTMHMLHHDTGKAYASVAASYGMMVGGGILGAKLACGGHGTKACETSGALTGLILGGASAVVLDAAILAWGAPSDAPPAKRARLWPSVVPLPSGAAVGLGGTF